MHAGGDTMAKTRTSKTEILAQVPAARLRDAQDRKAGQRAASAWYERAGGRVMLVMTNGVVFGFPARSIPALANVSAADLETVSLSPGGGSLQWNGLDVDLSVPGLILSAVQPIDRRRELARLAGQSTSRAKAAASRANGRKGGRPRVDKRASRRSRNDSKD